MALTKGILWISIRLSHYTNTAQNTVKNIHLTNDNKLVKVHLGVTLFCETTWCTQSCYLGWKGRAEEEEATQTRHGPSQQPGWLMRSQYSPRCMGTIACKE